MSFGRFLLAAIAGACALWVLIFFSATFSRGYHGTGVIYWDGVIGGRFSLEYLVMLYLPPLLMSVCSFFALRRPEGITDARN